MNIKSKKNKIQKDETDFDVIIIGGGASGTMASGRCAELGKKVLLLEKNKELGAKLKITGGGRCNITNAEFNVQTLLKNYSEVEKYLYSPFSQFGVKETFNFFEKRGLPLIIEPGKRAFPKTEKATDVLKVLEKYMRDEGVTFKTNSRVTEILKIENRIVGVKVGEKIYTAKSYIIATGGNSHPETGSTGDGFKWLEKIGHNVKLPTPTIVPLAIKENWVKSLSGITLLSMKITYYLDGKKSFSKIGKLLFTHFGISGPTIMNSAKKVDDLLHTGVVTAKIDIFPEINEAELEKKIIKLFDDNKNKMLKNVLSEIIPNGIVNVLLSFLKNSNLDIKVHSVSKEVRKDLVLLLKGLPMTITGLMGFNKAVVADGGVPLYEIDMRTMQSKIIDNLFITGDLLHINRPSGGFSLQLCWTSGYIAGSNA